MAGQARMMLATTAAGDALRPPRALQVVSQRWEVGGGGGLYECRTSATGAQTPREHVSGLGDDPGRAAGLVLDATWQLPYPEEPALNLLNTKLSIGTILTEV